MNLIIFIFGLFCKFHVILISTAVFSYWVAICIRVKKKHLTKLVLNIRGCNLFCFVIFCQLLGILLRIVIDFVCIYITVRHVETIQYLAYVINYTQHLEILSEI